MKNQIIYKEFMAELLGTLIIVSFGDGVCAMSSLFNLANYTNITLAWGIAVLLGILVSTRISGAHLNPAITLALVVTKRFSPTKAPHYIAAQMLGGFLGAALVYCFYRSKWLLVDPNFEHTASIFATFPAVAQFMPSLFAEITASALLMFGILSIVEHFLQDKAGFLAPFAVSALIMGIGMSFGGMHGYAMNPARDFSPRLFSALLGFKHNGLTDGSFIWVAPILGSLIGATVGALLFDITLGEKTPK